MGRRHGNLVADFQPLGVLVEHRVDDVNEGLVAREEAVAAGQEIALQPALALVLAEHLHHPAVGRQVVVPRNRLRHPGAVGDLEHVLPAVRVALVGTEEAEVPGVHVELHHVAEEPPHDPRRLGSDGAGCGYLHGIVAEIGQAQVAEKQAAVGMWVGAHATAASRRQLGQLGPEPTGVAEQLLGLVALHPLLEDAARGPGSRASRPSAPGASASSPPFAFRRSPGDRSSPWGCGG